MSNDIKCPLSILDDLVKAIDREVWVNTTAKTFVRQGVLLATARLESFGCMRINDNELDLNPLPKIDIDSLGLEQHRG